MSEKWDFYNIADFHDDPIKNQIKFECLEREVSPCVSACPFHLDVRELTARAGRGAFNLAYRLYHNATAFPAIVSELCDEPCAAVCVRKDLDSSLRLKMIERAAVEYATNKKPNNYNMRGKEQSVAVIGAGISGLACALRLASKKYAVTVYEKSGRIGGQLWDLMDPEVFLKEIELQFMYEKYELILNREIDDIEETVRSYDAVYIATGKNGSGFGIIPDDIGDRTVVATTLKKVFAGGALLGSNVVRSIADGLTAALTIDGFLRTDVMRHPQEHVPTKIHLDLSREKETPPVEAAGEIYTKEEASAEANRCIKCKCDGCYKACDMMQYFKKFPKAIEEEVHMTVYPGSLDGNGTVATRFISTCNQCGLCKVPCPEDIDIGIFLRSAHTAMRSKNAMPWAFHEFWLRDMEFADSDRASITYLPPETEKCEHLFFPGCQIGASDPDYVIKSYEYLLEKLPDTALALMCCGAPAIWAGDLPLHQKSIDKIIEMWEWYGRPEFIFACPTCMQLFKEYMPDIKGRMLVDVLLETGLKPSEKSNGEEVSVFDPCASRNNPETQKKVRETVDKAGYTIVPLEYNGEMAKCCSWGGQISIANPGYTRWLVNERTKENDLPYVVYCTNCRDIFADDGKPVRHILDIMFGLNKDWNRKPPTYSDRRRNREYLKRQLTAQLTGESGGEPMEEKLIMSGELADKLNKLKIIDEDILEVIEFCESTGRKLVDSETGHFTGYREVGKMTFWAEYSIEGDKYRLHNAYGHRMKIELEEVWDGRKQKIDM